MNISEFERTKPTKTFKLLNDLIKEYEKFPQIDYIGFKKLMKRLKEVRESFLNGE
jgi:SPX domain protein involved in polyphosphate accumulation